MPFARSPRVRQDAIAVIYSCVVASVRHILAAACEAFKGRAIGIGQARQAAFQPV